MKHFHRLSPCLLLIAALVALCASAAPAAEKRLNVLFIAVDDLRPELGCYGVKDIRTPCIDKLAASGIVFNRAYCQQAVCSPSRTSLLTGLRPDTTRVYDLQTHFRLNLPDALPLPQHFKQNGYYTRSLSKIYHHGLDDPDSWSEPAWFPRMQDYHKPASLEIINRNREKLKAEGELYKEDAAQRDARTGQTLKIKAKGKRVRGPSWEDPDVADNQLNDGRTADEAIKALQALKGKPFFLACGFLKPHLPFIAPQKYFEPYPLEKVRLAGNPNPPEDVPPPAMTDSGELRAYSDIPDKGPIPAEKARELVRAYYAAASYTDAQIGRVLDELERLGLADDTVVVLWGDHGWHLGEHGLWCKHTNFEVATRSVLLVRAPGRARGERTNALVEFVDIYPTLCELVGLPVPKGLEGASFAPLLKEPARPWKSAAFSQYPRKELMGHSMRTDRYRYTEWADRNGKVAPVGVELYDHQSDPGENVNLANRPECKELAARLAARLHAGWREALPGSKPAESDNAAPAAR